MSETKPKAGETSVCQTCDKEIYFSPLGYWMHAGSWQPRHVPKPTPKFEPLTAEQIESWRATALRCKQDLFACMKLYPDTVLSLIAMIDAERERGNRSEADALARKKMVAEGIALRQQEIESRAKAEAERDEARAEVERLRSELGVISFMAKDAYVPELHTIKAIAEEALRVR